MSGREGKWRGPARCSGIRLGLMLQICLLLCLVAVPWARAELPRTGQRSCFDGQGALIDQAQGTAQDGELQAGAVWPDPRFSDNGDGTVTDHLTGLIWLQDGACLGRLTWQAAMQAAAGGDAHQRESCKGLAAYHDWLVPEINQLELLFNAEEQSAASWLNRHRFREMQAGAAGYWSRTTGPNPYQAWAFQFDRGEVRLAGKVEEKFCLLVRQPADKGEGAAAGEPTPGRWQDNGDGTVTDRQSGLMWLKDGACLGAAAWQDALRAVQELNRDPARSSCQDLRIDFHDWSLPNRHELRSLIDAAHDLPALTPGYPITNLAASYWSSTTAAGQPTRAFQLLLAAGELQAGDKRETHGVWAVRPAGGGRPDRKRLSNQEASGGPDRFGLEPIGGRQPILWPAKRFTDHGDGTLTDNLTGFMWLNDGACFLPETWENAAKVIEVFNTDPSRLKCAVYHADYHNWQLPDITVLRDLVSGVQGEPAAWLKSQGATSVVARDYWVNDHNPLNLYYAWAVNLQDGTPRNYPMSFELHVWPVRLSEAVVPVTAAPMIKGNGREGKVSVQQGEELQLTAAIEQVSGAVPARFRIWYTAPDGKPRWLTAQGEWAREQADLYRGNLFVLAEAPVYRGDTTELATGDYHFFFAILPEPGPDEAAPQPLQAELHVTVTDKAEAAAPTEAVPAPAAAPAGPAEQASPEPPAEVTEEVLTK